MGLVSRLLGHRPTSHHVGRNGSTPSPQEEPRKGRVASDRYLRQLEAKLSADPQFRRDLEEQPPRTSGE
jgi:hypothetical protein